MAPGASILVDPFFDTGSDDYEWNACVGSQGSEENYVDGYIEAAIELASAVIDKRMYASRDTLAMPILYNGRHALELLLKFVIKHLHRMGALAEEHEPNHNILSLWSHLHAARIGDASTRALLDDLKPFMISLANIDSDGQQLRYAQTQSGEKSLHSISIVSLPQIRVSLNVMREIATKLKSRVWEMERERGTGSYTLECSRRDLREIAEMLGNHASWRDDSFNKRKAAVRTRFGLGSRKFSQAVTKIRESRELGALIGLEQPLYHLSDDKAVTVLEFWAKARPAKWPDFDDLVVDLGKLAVDGIFEEVGRRHELNAAVCTVLTSDELADLETLFYVGRDDEFGEDYQHVFEYRRNFPGAMDSKVDHLLSKTSLLENVINGARRLGRLSLASRLRATRLIVNHVGATTLVIPNVAKGKAERAP